MIDKRRSLKHAGITLAVFLLLSGVVSTWPTHPAQASWHVRSPSGTEPPTRPLGPATRPDLVVASLAAVTSRGDGKAMVAIEDVVRNRGKQAAGRSVTAFLVSSDSSSSKDDLRVGKRAVPQLRPGKRSRATTRLVLPVTTPPSHFFVIGCADARRKVVESKERNNCRTALAVPDSPADLFAADRAGTSLAETLGVDAPIMFEAADETLATLWPSVREFLSSSWLGPAVRGGSRAASCTPRGPDPPPNRIDSETRTDEVPPTVGSGGTTGGTSTTTRSLNGGSLSFESLMTTTVERSVPELGSAARYQQEIRQFIEIAYCPDERGVFTGTWESIRRSWASVTAADGAETASVELKTVGTLIGRVNDEARVTDFDLDIVVTKTEEQTRRAEGGPEEVVVHRVGEGRGSVTGRVPGGGSGGPATGSTSWDVPEGVEAGLRDQLQTALILAMMVEPTLVVDPAVRMAERAWTSGYCLELAFRAGLERLTVTPGAVTAIEVEVIHRDDGSRPRVPLVAKAFFSGEIVPEETWVPPPGEFTWTAPREVGEAQLFFETTSNRGRTLEGPTYCVKAKSLPTRFTGEFIGTYHASGPGADMNETIVATATFVRVPGAGGPLLAYEVVEGSATWSSSSQLGQCSIRGGPETAALTAMDGQILLNNSTTPYRYSGFGWTPLLPTETWTCGDDTFTLPHPSAFSVWFNTGSGGVSDLPLEEGLASTEGSSIESDGTSTYSWEWSLQVEWGNA